METAIPGILDFELNLMRRKAAEFRVLKMVKCKFGCGKGSAYTLGHPASRNAGTWCPIHGWLFFDSVKIQPEVLPR
jgi:hypothetical protein